MARPFKICPDCGAPYHRECYEKLGRCIHTPAHGAGYEWTFPYKDDALRTCPSCGERTLRSESVCRCCGAALPPEGAQEPADRADSDEHSEEFDYSTFYRQFQETGAPQVDPLRQTYQAAFGKEEVMDGIPCKDWADFIGPASPAYLSAYCRMQLSHTKTSMSFSAMLFGPFYFFYRKAWKPAFGFLAAELVVALPTLLSMMQATGSPLTAGISSTAIVVLSRIMTVFSFALVMLRTLYAKWLYRKSAAERIRRIRAEGVDREIFTLCKNEKYGQLIENLENVEDSASQMADFALSGQTVAQQITMLAGLTAEDADAALQHILSTDRMAVMDILPDGTAPLAENEEEAE